VGNGRTENSEFLCPDAACEGNADGWGERAGAAALTVGLIFWFLFHHREKEQKNVGLIFWLLFDQAKSHGKKTKKRGYRMTASFSICL